MNKCDLEETKHVALQKFLELAEKPELWCHMTCGKFIADYSRNLDGYREVTILVGRETIFKDSEPVINLEHESSQTPAKMLTYDEKLAEFNANVYVIAVKKLLKHYEDILKIERCERIQRNMQASCERIQKELADKPWWRFW